VRDIVEGGELLADVGKAQILAEEGAFRLLELERAGVPFDKSDDGRFKLRKTLGMSYPRAGNVKGEYPQGTILMDHLSTIVKEKGVQVYDNIMCTNLLMSEGMVSGAIGIDTITGNYWLFKAKAVVLAAGSATGLFKYTSTPEYTTGDAYGMAFRVGCTLLNMEFMEFTIVPVVNGQPVATGGIKPVTAAGAKLYNVKGERFMAKYDPKRMELTTRGRLVRAVYTELMEGRGPVMLDATHVPPELATAGFLKNLSKLGVDYSKELIPVVPALHSYLGGVKIDKTCATDLPGLFSAGESAGHGATFGADRLGGAITACFVFGYRAGRSASEFASRRGRVNISIAEKEKVVRFLEQKWKGGDYDLNGLREYVKEIAWNTIGIVRSGDSLSEGYKRFTQLEREVLPRKSAKDLKDTISLIELENLVLTGRLVAYSALLRTETRGQHIRSDYPNRNDQEWLKWIGLYMWNGDLHHRFIPLSQ
jgi:succinate dehydrogenase/fumarate reductase flavoprotein subunit